MARNQHARQSVTLFYSYASEDAHLQSKLQEHLSSLQREGLVDQWHERQIVAGTVRKDALDAHLNSASLILLLVSPSFLASDYCFGIEMQRALERHWAGEAYVIPVILRPVDWHHTPFATLQPLPRDATPIVSWSNQDDAFLDVAKSIRHAVEHWSAPSLSPPSFPDVWNIPYAQNPFFTGRQDILETVAAALKVDRAAALTQPYALSGLGGIGKTQIAVEYAYRYRSLYQEVLWVQAETHESLVSSFVAIAQILNLPEKQTRDQTMMVNAVKAWMKTHPAWLLIFDNGDHLHLLRPFLPPIVGGHILITTRAHATGKLARRIQVEIMSPEVGALFLLRRATLLPSEAPFEQASFTDREAALHIAQELEGLPLALDQAGAYLEATRCGLAWYRNALQSQSIPLLKRREGLDIDHPAPVATTWLLSFEHIKQMNPAAAELLSLCAFLYPDAIPEEIAIQGMALLEEQGGASVTDPLFFNDLLEALHTASLVKRDTANHTLSIHRLVQAVLKDTLAPDVYRQWTERAVRAVNAVLPRAEFKAWPLCERCLTNALVCASLIEQEQLLFPEAGNLLNNAGRYLMERGRHAEAERLLQQALALREQCLGPEHPDTATSLNNLGSLSFYRGRYLQAEQFHRRSLAIRAQAFGADHPMTGISLNNVGWICYALGKYTEAEHFYTQALAIYQHSQGTDHPETITTITNLAWLYYRQGRYNEAEQFYLQALAAQQRRGETTHPNMGRILNNLALLYTEWARYAEAEPMQKQADSIWEQCYGLEHPETMMSHGNLAFLYRKQGKYAEAEQLYTHILQFRKKHLGEDHPDTAKTLRHLAELYTEQEKYSEAEALYLQVLTLREISLGKDHPDTALVLNDLAFLLYKKGRLTEAEPLYIRALTIGKQQLGDQSLDVARYAHNLAQLYDAQGNSAGAEPLYLQALAMREQSLGPSHPDTISTMNTYASFLRSMRREAEAEQLEARRKT